VKVSFERKLRRLVKEVLKLGETSRGLF
jgi:hypothetical protein